MGRYCYSGNNKLYKYIKSKRNDSAGLVAKKAVEYGLEVKPWVKTSLAPGSKVVSDYLIKLV